MGFEQTILRERRLVHLTGSGDLDAEACLAALRALDAGLAGETGFGVLVDMRDTDYLGSTGEIRQFVDLIGGLGGLRGHRFAVVVRSEAQFGLGRMFATFLEMVGGRANVFRTPEPALAWLDKTRPK